MEYGAIIAGCGLTGGVIARFLAEDLGMRVLIVDRRDHIAGNMYDYQDENGFLVQQYGPHVFHTVERELHDYMTRFDSWFDYRVTCKVFMEGKFTPSPFNYQTIDDYYSADEAAALKAALEKTYPGSAKETITTLLASPNPLVKAFADFLFEKDYSIYTAKQWGISPQEIDPSVLARVPVLFSYKDGYFDDPYQMMPVEGFTAFYKKLIDHPSIEVRLNCDIRSLVEFKEDGLYRNGVKLDIPVVYTGPPDELLGYRFGPLPYRSLRFDFKTETVDSFQDAPIVAYPAAPDYTRITEFTKMPPQATNGRTVYAVEYPQPYNSNQEAEPYYPILTTDSQALHERYQEALNRIPNLFLCGRLADFKYYNMDQALKRALTVCHKLKSFLNA